MTLIVARFATPVIFDPARQGVFPQKQEDFRICALAGGGVEDKQAPEQAAVCKTLEERGYRSTIKRLIGRYHRSLLMICALCF